MNNRFPHSLLPPLLIGILSLLGLCGIASYAWLTRQNQNTAVIPRKTTTPFKYALVATETALVTETPPAAEALPLDVEVSPLPPDLGDIPTQPSSNDRIPSQSLPATNAGNTTRCVSPPIQYFDAILASVTAMDPNNEISSAWIVESNDMVQLTIFASRVYGPDLALESTPPGVWGMMVFDDGSFDIYALNETAEQYSNAFWGIDATPALTMELDGAQEVYNCASSNP